MKRRYAFGSRVTVFISRSVSLALRPAKILLAESELRVMETLLKPVSCWGPGDYTTKLPVKQETPSQQETKEKKTSIYL